MRIVTAVYERDPKGNWLARPEEEPRCHTWGRSLPAARQGIRDAVELWTEELGVSDANDLDIRDDVRVPHADEALKLASRRIRLAKELADLRAEADELAGLLLGEGLSVRDVAALVGLTPGRISQIAPVQAGEKRDERASTASLPRVRTPHRHGDGDSPSSPSPTSFKSGDVSAT